MDNKFLLKGNITYDDETLTSDSYGNAGTWMNINTKIPILAIDKTSSNNNIRIWMDKDSNTIRLSGVIPSVTHTFRIYYIYIGS